MKKGSNNPFSAWGNKCWTFFLVFFIGLNYHGFAQQTRVAGTVRDSKGAGVSGVSVTVKGTSIGTTTDNRGAFSLDVPSPESVLAFTSVGYVDKEMKVGDQKMITVTLANKASDLDEVIVIGYGQTQ